ncbi:MAG: aldehyde dehydrogenase family protein [Sandaracinaceae bacterium]|nr:aldehyde dehydrogenase family protein [Sandaracinaceae bacterium]
MSTAQPLPRNAAATPDVIDCVEPATLASLGSVPVDGPDAVRDAVARARVAQRAWGASSFDERRAVLRAILAHVLDHADELCELVVRDAGKTKDNALLGEVWPVCEKLRWTIANGEKHLLPEPMSSGLFVHKRATVLYQPLGVIGVICPWNYPLQNVLGPTIPALFAGNAVVVKVSEQVAWSSERIQRIFDEALEAHGFSRDTVQIVNGYGATGAALVRSGVDKIVFTGSVPNGRRILEGSVENITPVILELGGKDAFIVCEDAHVEQAVHAALAGVFISAGQSCMAAERVLVHERVYDDFVARVTTEVSRLRTGSALDREVDVGAIVSDEQLALIEELVDDAIAKGARALSGGKRGDAAGRFFEPTVLVDVKPGMAILTEELFGPVLVIRRVASDEEAIAIANETRFGLGSTVMSKSRPRARKIAEALRVGSCTVNDFGFTYMAQDLPFGGVDASGFGRLNGREGLRACTNPKAILEDRFPLHLPAKIYPSDAATYPLVREALRVLYQPTLRGRAKAALGLLRRARS